MKLEIEAKSLTGVDATSFPTIEHVYIPSITNEFDDPVTTASVSIDIDGTLYHQIYSDGDTIETDTETFKLGATATNTTKNANQTIDLSALSSGDYILTLYAENNYADGTEIEQYKFTIA